MFMVHPFELRSYGVRTDTFQGLGPIGLLAARWCQLEGARRIIGIDNVPERIQLAKTKLGIEIINFDSVTDVVAEINKTEPHGVDCAIDAAGFR